MNNNHYLLMADLLGFGQIVKNSGEHDLDDNIKKWTELVEMSQKHANTTTKPQLISDTIFCREEDSAAGLKRLIKMARHLLEEGTKNSLLIRGAITYGPIKWGKFTYGKPVIEAHRLEMDQDWIGVVCGNELPHIAQCYGSDGLACYPAPFKSGPITLCACVVWDVPDAEDLVIASTNYPLTQQGEELQSPWQRRIKNTYDFRKYLADAGSRKSWSTFPQSLRYLVSTDD